MNADYEQPLATKKIRKLLLEESKMQDERFEDEIKEVEE